MSWGHQGKSFFPASWRGWARGVRRGVVVEVERPPQEKVFLGGYRQRQTGVLFHHAAVQTQPRPRPPRLVEVHSRDTQVTRTHLPSRWDWPTMIRPLLQWLQTWGHPGDTEGSQGAHPGVTEGSPRGHRGVTQGSQRGHPGDTEGSPRGHRGVTQGLQ
jgi:hypothetical protein